MVIDVRSSTGDGEGMAQPNPLLGPQTRRATARGGHPGPVGRSS
jgi:hypothetical protein